MSEAIVKTGDAGLDRKIESAKTEASKMTEDYDYDLRKKTVLRGIFKAAIGFRVSECLKVDEQKKRYAQKIDCLYALLPRVGLDEEKVVSMVRKIAGIIVY